MCTVHEHMLADILKDQGNVHNYRIEGNRAFHKNKYIGTVNTEPDDEEGVHLAFTALKEPIERSFREWFQLLDEPYRSQIIENVKKHHPEGPAKLDYVSGYMVRLSEVIQAAFDWSRSEEGHRYWADLWRTIEDADQNEQWPNADTSTNALKLVPSVIALLLTTACLLKCII